MLRLFDKAFTLIGIYPCDAAMGGPYCQPSPVHTVQGLADHCLNCLNLFRSPALFHPPLNQTGKSVSELDAHPQ